MSKKQTKHTDKTSSDVLEGEIVEDIAGEGVGQGADKGAAGGAGVADEQKTTSKTGKITKYVLVVAALGAATWFGLPIVKGGLNSVFPTFFAQNKPEQNIELSENIFSAESAYGELSSDTAALGEKLRGLEIRLAELESAPSPDLVVVEPTAEVDVTLYERLDSLELALSNMEQQTVDSPPPQTVDQGAISDLIELRQRLSALEDAPVVVATPIITVADSGLSDEAGYFMSLVSLSRAVTSGKVYDGQLLELQAFKGAGLTDEITFDGLIASLKAYSEKGVPTDKDILSSFRTTALMALTAEDRAVELSWWQRLWSNITGLVSVRQKGDVAGDSVEALLARAEVRLERGDYKDAQEILLGTTLTEQRALAPLLDMLEAKLNSQNALNSLITTGLQGQGQ